MSKSIWTTGGVSLVALMAVVGAPALAQDQAADSGVTEVVVTGVARKANKLDSSISVSAIQVEDMQKFAPRSAAEVFRNIPGVRSESTGGEGNANIAVRGLPVAAGGAKFLQLQEDGLPILEFGDIAFGNADIFLRTDLSVGRVEAIRGGTASTLASNSPGGIINIISKTGAKEGGTLQLTQGIDFGQTRGDFEFGGALSDKIDFHVGGFYRSGEGPRKAGYTANQGGQIKANITRKFDNGFLRMGVKYLNDKAIGYLPMPMKVTGTNGDPKWSSAPGLDAKSDTVHSVYFMQDAGLDGSNNRSVTNVRDGMAPKSLVFNGSAVRCRRRLDAERQVPLRQDRSQLYRALPGDGRHLGRRRVGHQRGSGHGGDAPCGGQWTERRCDLYGSGYDHAHLQHPPEQPRQLGQRPQAAKDV